MQMKRYLFILLIILLFNLVVFSQNKPFEIFEKALKEEKAGFSGNKENLSKVFNQERIRLGENFERQLWIYLADDVEKHYWINSFVESDSYLHGNVALPILAFEIRREVLKLLENRNDRQSLGRKVTLNRKQAIFYHNTGKNILASEKKSIAETILKEKPDISPYVAGMTRLDSCIYQNLGKDTSFCAAESKKPVEIIVSSGIVNKSAIYLPQPSNPNKLIGRVFVKVLISEKGEVLSAEAYEGTKELFENSVDAAKNAKFSPLLLSGKPTKRSGLIVYEFKN